MITRILSAAFGGILFGIFTPIVYLLLIGEGPLDSFVNSLILLVAAGFALGAMLGAIFPKPFEFLFEMITDI